MCMSKRHTKHAWKQTQQSGKKKMVWGCSIITIVINTASTCLLFGIGIPSTNINLHLDMYHDHVSLPASVELAQACPISDSISDSLCDAISVLGSPYFFACIERLMEPKHRPD